MLMSKPGHYYYLICACGHALSGRVDELPVGLRNSTTTHIAMEALPKLVCTACGRRGRPGTVSGSYSTGNGYRTGGD